jgi:hypothetical protein
MNATANGIIELTGKLCKKNVQSPKILGEQL